MTPPPGCEAATAHGYAATPQGYIGAMTTVDLPPTTAEYPTQRAGETALRRFLRENALSLVLFVLFFGTFLFGQSLAGHRAYNAEQKSHGEPTVSYPRYLTTGDFGEATFENWESEFLQMGAFVLLTVWLRQKGSAESKKIDEKEPVDEDPDAHRDDPDAPWPVRRGGLPLRLYKHSLSLAFFALFLGSFLAHAATGAAAYNAEQLAHGDTAVSVVGYMQTSQFWFESLQNWQSEFLAVGSIVVLTIFLRQHGSPESKPVHAPHSETGSS